MNIITDAVFKNNVNLIKTQGAKIDNALHEGGLYAINQVNLHGNTNAINKLLGAMNKSGRKEAFITWLRDHAMIRMNKLNQAEYVKGRKIYGLDTKAFEGEVAEINEKALNKANAIPFWNYTKESKPMSSFDVLSRLESLYKSATSFEGVVEHKELISNIAMLIEGVKKEAPKTAPKAQQAKLIKELGEATV